MGIPHLITHLRPFATRQLLAGQQLVIDGPALCHHLYYLCLGMRSEANNYFEAAPSYSEVGDTLLAYLEGLEGAGAVM